MAAGLPADGGGALPVRLPRVGTGAFKVEPVTTDELRQTVLGMNGSRACGPDGIPMHFIKKCFDAIAHVILSVLLTHVW